MAVLRFVSVHYRRAFFINNWPFYGFKYDQYQGDLKTMPYKNFINYVNQHQGLTFWAHPEQEYINIIDGVRVETRDYTNDLLRLDNYTGFTIFYGGYDKVGCIGCLWDEMLKEHCRGQRKAPIWAIAGLTFSEEEDLEDYLKNLRTILLVPYLHKNEVFQALKQGSMYVIRGKDAWRFLLDEFSVQDAQAGIKKTMGQTLKSSGKTKLKIKGHFLRGQDRLFNIQLIRDGAVIKTFEATSPFDISYQDEYTEDKNKIYYRLEIQSEDLLIITNPIFVERRVKI
jgi:hypothetical protein